MHFVAAYNVMHRWRKMPDSASPAHWSRHFAFPIPLKKNGDGWFFDAGRGKG